MNRPRRKGPTGAAFLVLAVIFWVPATGAGQAPAPEGSEGASASLTSVMAEDRTPAASDPDFLFQPPRVSLGFRWGFHSPRAGSDVFDFITDELTLDRNDFRGAAWEGELGIRATDRADVVLALGHSRSSERSEFRDYEGDDGLPIEQTTELRVTPMTAGLRVYLLPQGTAVGNFAWVPASAAPYLSGGVGLVHYHLEQRGEFVDFQDLRIFRDTFESSEWGSTIHLAAGTNVKLTRRAVFTAEGRYRWGSAELRGDFVDFDPIDLGGFQATLGVTLRF